MGFEKDFLVLSLVGVSQLWLLGRSSLNDEHWQNGFPGLRQW